MKTPANKQVNRAVYACRDESGQIVYVGSTELPLKRLEYNHRNAHRNRGWTMSDFRIALYHYGRNWTFEWLVEPFKCCAWDIEKLEGELIREHSTKYNVDKDPVRSSIRNGRYTLADTQQVHLGHVS